MKTQLKTNYAERKLMREIEKHTQFSFTDASGRQVMKSGGDLDVCQQDTVTWSGSGILADSYFEENGGSNQWVHHLNTRKNLELCEIFVIPAATRIIECISYLRR